MSNTNTNIKNVVITGVDGQLGYHCRARLQHHHGFVIHPIGRAQFNDPNELGNALVGADVVVHLAGVNRGEDADVRDGNLEISETLVAAIKASGRKPHLIYASSIQVDNGSIYGEAKKRVGEVLSKFAEQNGLRFASMVLPNLFGEFSRPNYNNFTATFCDQISKGKTPSVHQDSAISLMHYLEVADLIADLIHSKSSGEYRPVGTPTSVATIATKLESFHKDYAVGVVPDIRHSFDLYMFNALRSHMFENQFPYQLVRHADARGSFFECIRSRNSGQTSFSTTVPNVTRGEHFHFHKVERFLVLSGEAKISLRKLYSEDVIEYEVDSGTPVFVDMPTFYTHNISNTGSDELLTLFWTHDFFDPENTDTYTEAV